MSPSSGNASSTRLLALGLLVLAFVAGALGGVAADRLLGSREVARELSATRAAGQGRSGPGGGRARGAIFPPGAQLARQLNLTPEQRERIVAILTTDRAKADSVLRAVRPALQARYDSTSAAVRAILTPEQRDRFDRLRDRRRRSM